LGAQSYAIMFWPSLFCITGGSLGVFSLRKVYKRRVGISFVLRPEVEFALTLIFLVLLTLPLIWTPDSPLLVPLGILHVHLHKSLCSALTVLIAGLCWIALTQRRIQELDTEMFCETLREDPTKPMDHLATKCALAINSIMSKMLGKAAFRYLIRGCFHRVTCRVMHEAEQVHKLLKLAHENNVLNHVITRIKLAHVLEFASCTHMWQMLMETEVTGQYSLKARVALLTALQQVGRLRTDEQMQDWAVELIRGVPAEKLASFKNLCNAFGRFHSFYNLVTKHITQQQNRDALYSILKKELPGEASCQGSAATPCIDKRTGPLKVLSDIDDTLLCSGGFPAGVDTSFPTHFVYPGLCSLLKLLDHGFVVDRLFAGSSHPLDPIDNQSCNIVFLSARPHLLKDVSESVTYDLFKQLVNYGRFRAMPTLIPGDFFSSVRSILNKVINDRILRRSMPWAPMGEQKFQGMEMFSKLHPESALVFFGDNGQGDVLAAEKAQERREGPLLRAAFIHEVLENIEETTTSFGEMTLVQRKQKWEELNIFFVCCPLEAACKAKELHLIDLEGVKSVCKAAREDLDDLSKLHSLHVDDNDSDYKKHIDKHDHFSRIVDNLIAMQVRSTM